MPVIARNGAEAFGSGLDPSENPPPEKRTERRTGLELVLVLQLK